jgi:hypothetical protein
MIRTLHIPALALALFVTSAATATAQKLPPDIPVTTTIADLGLTDWPLQTQSDRKGAYVRKVVNKVKQIESALVATPNGYDFMLTTYYSSKGKLVDSDRKVFYDLREQTAVGSFATPPLGIANNEAVPYGTVTTHVAVKCSQSGVDMVKMAAGDVGVCQGTFRFRALDNLWYRLSFNPENFPGVDRVKVACTAADSSGCKVWTLTPDGTTLTYDDPNVKNKTTLVHIDEGGTILAVGGNYNISFSMTIAR